ncbi:M20/M25/M40 family metallo-hydrolase [Streptomyces sp. WAC07061]|uniref:M20/M25/M40 family metallo-hydrolase n=1 Tax=Streptomyces sp. WAC07061 TaxID=2487410 RepID=UPI000F788DEC|nr:M20/M25/M40 family metallo-hydrolase [Streptomyces sp. WAC07061]RSS52270.1 M20/M25/M40 family metallo-hydrolase [Streptomyces sp. WAC07061]
MIEVVPERRDAVPCPEPYAIGLLRSMLRIPSPSCGEAPLARHVVAAMTELGFTRARVDEAGNAVGEIVRGEGPTVMLLGHMDTVSGSVPVRVEGDRLYGRGAVDAKGPLASMICAAVNAEGFRGRLVVVGAVEEETPGSRGAVFVREAHVRPDALIIGEPSGWDTVVLGYKGKLDLRYRVECPATHPSSPAPQAAEQVAAGWRTLLSVLGSDPADPRAGGFDEPTATLVSVSGDPVSAEAEYSIRTPLGYDTEGLVAELRRQLAPRGTLDVVGAVAACRTGRGDPVVRSLSAAIRSRRAAPRMKVKSGTSDMNTLAEAWQVPMATYGPGDSALDHADDEHILLSEYLDGIGVLASALEDIGRRLGCGRDGKVSAPVSAVAAEGGAR